MTVTCKGTGPRRAACGTATLLVALIVLAGCAEEGPTRFDLSGTITYGGQPVPIGYVVFEPDSGAENSGPGAHADIKDGQYSTRANRGTIGGPHLVQIYAYDGKAYQVSADGITN